MCVFSHLLVFLLSVLLCIEPTFTFIVLLVLGAGRTLPPLPGLLLLFGRLDDLHFLCGVCLLTFSSLSLQRQLLQLLQDVVLAAGGEELRVRTQKRRGWREQRTEEEKLVLKVVLLSSFLLYFLPFWLFRSSGSFDLGRQSVDVDAVIFGTEDRSITSDQWIDRSVPD